MSSASEMLAHYTESELELLDENCRTALPFDDEDHQEIQLIEEMGRRAKAKRQRAARLAVENQMVQLGNEQEQEQENDEQNSRSDETDCEIPSTQTARSPSKIPILQKGYHVSKAAEKPEVADNSSSKIPRPKAQLVYLNDRDELPSYTGESEGYDTSEPPSFTASSGSFTDSEMISDIHKATIPQGVTPLPQCDLSTELESLTKESDEKPDPEHLVVIAEANGTEIKLDMTAMLSGLDMDLVGLRFL